MYVACIRCCILVDNAGNETVYNPINRGTKCYIGRIPVAYSPHVASIMQ